MAVYYIDPEGGTPGANGLSYANRAMSQTSISLTNGDVVRYVGGGSYSSVGGASWMSVEHPQHNFTSSHRLGGGSFVSVTGTNTTTWTWTINNHGLFAGDYFKVVNQSSVISGLFKVASVTGSNTFTTTISRPLTLSSAFGASGYAVYATNQVVKLASPSTYVTPVELNNVNDVNWSAFSGTTSTVYSGPTTTQYGAYGQGGANCSVYLSTTSGTGLRAYRNLPSAISLGGKTCLNWWFNPVSNGYVRYWTNNGYNGYGSGERSIRLYSGTNCSGQYVEFFFPFHGNVSGRWLPCSANVYNPSGVDLNTFTFQCIAVNHNGGYGTMQYYLSQFYLSLPRPTAPNSSFLSNSANAGNLQSINLHTLIGSGSVYNPEHPYFVYWPVAGITEWGDIVLGGNTNFNNPVTNQGNAGGYTTRGYVNQHSYPKFPYYVEGRYTYKISEYATTYIQQMVRRDFYYTNTEFQARNNTYNLTFSGGWTHGSSMETQSGDSFIDGQCAYNDFMYFNTSFAMINSTYSRLGAIRFYQGTYIGGLVYQMLFDRVSFIGNGSRGIYLDSYHSYTSNSAGQLYAASTSPNVGTREYGVRFTNCKNIANATVYSGQADTIFGGSRNTSAVKHYQIEDSFYSFSNYGSGLVPQYCHFEGLTGCDIVIKNNYSYGFNSFAAGHIDIDGDLTSMFNWNADFRTFGVDTTYIDRLSAGYRSWNGSSDGGSSSYFNVTPVYFGTSPSVRIRELTIDNRYSANAVQLNQSNVGISTLIWSMSGIDYNFTAEADYTGGPCTILSAEYLSQNGTRKPGWSWKNFQRYGWYQENPDGTAYAYNNTGKSWKFTPGNGMTIGSPGVYNLGQIPVDGQSPITISCKYYNLDIKNGIKLKVKRNNCGILTDLSVSPGTAGAGTTGSWQDLSLTVYPTLPGVLDATLEYWNNSAPTQYVGQSFYIDEFTFS